jgi:hypothetical protein
MCKINCRTNYVLLFALTAAKKSRELWVIESRISLFSMSEKASLRICLWGEIWRIEVN